MLGMRVKVRMKVRRDKACPWGLDPDALRTCVRMEGESAIIAGGLVDKQASTRLLLPQRHSSAEWRPLTVPCIRL